jgi:hypothetical protein
MRPFSRSMLASLLMLACSSSVRPANRQLLRSDLDDQLTAVEGEAASLGSRWDGILDSYQAAEREFTEADRTYQRASVHNQASSEGQRRARATYEEARTRWLAARYLIQVAALLDAQRLDEARGIGGSHPELGCGAGMSTAAYRALLIAGGMNLDGLEVDHIVPRFHGGADHPANYQLLSVSTNRSWGADWSISKCSSAGPQRCANAVAVSRACGNYRGGIP